METTAASPAVQRTVFGTAGFLCAAGFLAAYLHAPTTSDPGGAALVAALGTVVFGTIGGGTFGSFALEVFGWRRRRS